MGAGLSATASPKDAPEIHPPTWAKLLVGLGAESLSQDRFNALKPLVEERRYTEAAQVLKANADQMSFDRSMRKHLVSPKFIPSQCHWDLMSLDAKVVISLNFDRIYETVCDKAEDEDYVFVDYYDDQLINHMRSRRRVVLRLHGSVDTPAKTILSMHDYNNIKATSPQVYDVVRALLLTNTVLFLGCGFNGDPDMDLLLQENAFASKSTYPHYALVPEGGAVPEVRVAQGDIMKMRFLEYPCPKDADGNADHSAFVRATSNLAEKVLNMRSLSV